VLNATNYNPSANIDDTSCTFLSDNVNILFNWADTSLPINGLGGSYTDVYSLGQLLWHMLTNERAGIHSEENRITKIEENGHPRWVADLINKAVVPDEPNKRIQSAFEFRIRLENEGNYQE
jgi:hypothetical protein